MPVPERLVTKVSTKGRIVLPKAIRRALHWQAGTRLAVDNTPEGVLLKPAPVPAETRTEDVFGCLAGAGPPKSLKEMGRAFWRRQGGAMRTTDTNIVVRHPTADNNPGQTTRTGSEIETGETRRTDRPFPTHSLLRGLLR